MIMPVIVQQKLGNTVSKQQLLDDISQIEDDDMRDVLSSIVLAMAHRCDNPVLGDGTWSFRETGNAQMSQAGVSMHVLNKNAADTGFSSVVGDAPYLVFKARFTEQVETTQTPTSEPDLREYFQYGAIPLAKKSYHQDKDSYGNPRTWVDAYPQNKWIKDGAVVVDTNEGMVL